ncbi:MAG TPA: M56 family metallopeptidase, partial [Flavisolibacter sp.]|nr:M56 family metallopeptidase [Flavisolibacter sp.]
AGWSQSHFLQALGWATLNSFWQMALLWSIYTALGYLFPLNAHKKYQLSAIAIMAGFTWFIATFVVFYFSSSVSAVPLFGQYINGSGRILNIFLFSASLTYLGLLCFPAYKLFSNWKYVGKVRTAGIRKADLQYRLFVQKIAAQLGIKKKVLVYLSELINSPVTVGYIKPVILLPVAALNNLSTDQVEAVLLHELSHIRRYDYLINLIVKIIQTLLYFNPFMKMFMKNIEEERENCCDQLVLQFGYDRVGYATALLSLEKAAARHLLIMSAGGKKYLLNRIEKIVGMEKKNGFKLNQFTGIIGALVCIVLFNSILILKEEKRPGYHMLAYNNISNPIPYFGTDEKTSDYIITPVNNPNQNYTVAQATKPTTTPVSSVKQLKPVLSTRYAKESSISEDVINVDYDPVDASLSTEQKDKVKSTVSATRKVISNLEWKVAENNIADALTEEEKVKAKQVYLQKLENDVNWKNIEDNLKTQYDNIDWTKIDNNLSNALTFIKLDSIQKNYNLVLAELDKARVDACTKAKVQNMALPDQSIEEIKKSRDQVHNHIIELKALRNKKIVRL